jgi:hypothetical protein
MHIDKIANFLTSLQIMWKGMLGLFIVAIFVMLITMLLMKIFSGKRADKSAAAQPAVKA